MIELRDYQKKAVDEIRLLFASGCKKVLLHAATGAGKGIIISHIMQAVANKRKKCLFVVRGRNLVNLASKRLPIDHGVLMANHVKFDLSKPVQICSIDTIRARAMYPETELIIIDEVHQACGKSYVDFAAQYPDKLFLGVTATPYTKKPINHICEKVVYPISHQSLVDQGFLVPGRYFCAQKIDLSEVEVSSTGDYKEDQLGTFMSKGERVRNIAPNWKKFGEGRPTICFAVTIEHSKTIQAHFEAHGVPCAHLDAKSSDEERSLVTRQLESGEIKVIVNVGIMHVGVDVPCVSCVLHCRPTLSLIWYLQACGRGTRPYQGKKNLIILDMANNVLEHGFIETEHEACLAGMKKRDKGEVPLKVCPECFSYILIQQMVCPHCDHTFERETHSKKDVEVTLSEFKTGLSAELRRAKIKKFALMKIAHKNNLKRGWVYYQLVAKFGKDIAQQILPWTGSSEVTSSDLV